MGKIKWCFLRGGVRLVAPNENISKAYLDQAEMTLSKIKKLIEEEDFLWASVRIYYCAYYSLYSFLQRVGVKSENHDCSIEIVKTLIARDFVKDIDFFKKERVDSQYYLRFGQKSKLLDMYGKVKNFYFEFREIVEKLDEGGVLEMREKLGELS
jgi:uncharacterized protein (UPF0332 family)